MNGTKHTPGPWKISESGAIYAAVEGGPVARIVPRNMRGAVYDDSQDRANARLIAAAPDLLAALEAAPKPVALPSREWAIKWRDWYDGPRAAALAKAKGKP